MTAAALAVFAQYPDAGEVFVTEDAQAFLEEGHARNHARQSGMPMPVRFGRESAVKVDVLADLAEAMNNGKAILDVGAEATAKAEAEAAEKEAKAKAAKRKGKK